MSEKLKEKTKTTLSRAQSNKGTFYHSKDLVKSTNALTTKRPIRNTKNRNTSIELNGDNKQLEINSTNKNSQINLNLYDVVKIFQGKKNKRLEKLFAFILSQANKQNFEKIVTFSASDLFFAGIYSSIDTSSQRFRDDIVKIMDIIFKKNCLIDNYQIANSHVQVWINENINIEFLSQYFAYLPNFAFELSDNAFSLMTFISFLALKSMKLIKETGHFNIDLEVISDYLELKNKHETKTYSQYIDVIEEAIKRIEKVDRNRWFIITLHSNIYYKDGFGELDSYIEIEVTNEFAELFIKIANNTDIPYLKRSCSATDINNINDTEPIIDTNNINNSTNNEDMDKNKNLDQFHLFYEGGKIKCVFDKAIVKYIIANYNLFVINDDIYIYKHGVYVRDHKGIEVKDIIQSCIYDEFYRSTTVNRIYKLFLKYDDLSLNLEDLNYISEREQKQRYSYD